VPQLLAKRPVLLIVEGESDCWTAWSHGFAALGIPGGDSWDALNAAHLGSAVTVCIVVESEADPHTYPYGIGIYVANVRSAVRAVGFTGRIVTLRLPDGLNDINELYQAAPEAFESRLSGLLADAAAGIA